MRKEVREAAEKIGDEFIDKTTEAGFTVGEKMELLEILLGALRAAVKEMRTDLVRQVQ